MNKCDLEKYIEERSEREPGFKKIMKDMELKKHNNLYEHRNFYKCGWSLYRSIKYKRKLIYKEFKDKVKLVDFCWENDIRSFSNVSEKFDLEFVYNMEYFSYAIRLFNLCFGVVSGKPLYTFESIPSKNKRKRRAVYLQKLCFTLAILAPGHQYHNDICPRINASFRYKIEPQGVLTWLQISGIELEEIKSLEKGCHVFSLLKYLKGSKGC